MECTSILPPEVWQIVLSNLPKAHLLAYVRLVCTLFNDLVLELTKVQVLSLGESALGFKGKDMLVPQRVAAFNSIPYIRQVASGWFHSFILTQEGRLWTFGKVRYCMGFADSIGTTLRAPALVKSLDGIRIRQVAAGQYHTLALAENGEVYSFGNMKNGLGHPDSDRKAYTLPTRIEALAGVRAVQVAAGVRHSLVLSDTGQVYGFGRGEQGCPGHGHTNYVTLPQIVFALKDIKVVRIACGGFHNVVLTDNGEVWTWGWGHHGALGHGDSTQQNSPMKVEALADEKVYRIFTGRHQTFVINEAGHALAFGCGVEARLGLGDSASRYLPCPVTALYHEFVVKVTSAEYHTLFLTRGGKVYSCGNEEAEKQVGRLGQANLPVLRPQVIPYLENHKIVDISAGRNFSLFLAGSCLPDFDNPFSTS
ncbi:E3 ubiquitin-protein ligase herc2 [Balamuthia mandrillaris]